MAVRFVLAVLALWAFTSEAAACSCSNGGATTAARRSQAVYLARVTSLGRTRADQFGTVRVARLVVTQPVKGVRQGDTVTVEYPADNSCSPGFVVGREYLVYAIADPQAGGVLRTDYCAGTKPITCAAHDLKQLRAIVARRARNCVPVPKEGPPARGHARVSVRPALSFSP